MVPEGEAVDQTETAPAADETESAETVVRSTRVEQRSRVKQASKMSGAEMAFLALNACPRCSYFAAGYRLGHNDLDPAGVELDHGWLQLTGDHATRRLVAVAFGVELEEEVDFFSGCCCECRRVFTLQRSTEAGEPGVMRFRVTGLLSDALPQKE
jgi:hypothetical protein